MCVPESKWWWKNCTFFRYIAVCKPLRVLHLSTLRGIKIQMFLVVLISHLIEIPRYLESHIETFTYKGHTHIAVIPSDLYMSDLYQLLYKTLFLVILRRFVPMVVIVVLTVKLTSTVRSTRKVRSELIACCKPKHTKGQPNETITLVLIIIALIFIVCQAPGMIYPIFRLTLERDTCNDFFYYYASIADLLSVLCSGLNFFVYYLLVPVFRKQLKKLLCGQKRNRRIQPHRFGSYKVNIISHPDSTKIVTYPIGTW